MSHKMCPRKQTTEPKIADLGYQFSQEMLLHTLMPAVIASTYSGKYAVPFIMCHPVYVCVCFRRSVLNRCVWRIGRGFPTPRPPFSRLSGSQVLSPWYHVGQARTPISPGIIYPREPNFSLIYGELSLWIYIVELVAMIKQKYINLSLSLSLSISFL